MELLNIFKKNPPAHKKKAELAYNYYNKKDLSYTPFPGGKQQAENIIFSIAKICSIPLEDCDVKKYCRILSAFSDVLIKQNFSGCSDEHIIKSLQINHGDYIKNNNVASQVLKFCKLNMDDPSFALNTIENCTLLNEMSPTIHKNNESKSEKLNFSDYYFNDPDYGLCPDKPIFTIGPDDTQNFLKSLKGPMSEELVWKNNINIKIENLPHKVSAFDSYISSGNKYKTIYISECKINKIKKIPKGFQSEKLNCSELSIESQKGYYFENIPEFIIYGKTQGNNHPVTWLSGNNYWDMYQNGYIFFECGQYTEAINAYKECLKLNPIGLSSRFELVECYIITNRLSLARKSLLDMKDYLFDNKSKARFYRRLGYIAIEEKSYKEAYSCYKLSLEYEDDSSVIDEIRYIESKTSTPLTDISVKKVLEDNLIPVL